MTEYWVVNYTTWPFNGGEQKDIGEERRTHDIKAQDFDEAVMYAKWFLAGVRSSPLVWNAFITSVTSKKDR